MKKDSTNNLRMKESCFNLILLPVKNKCLSQELKAKAKLKEHDLRNKRSIDLHRCSTSLMLRLPFLPGKPLGIEI